MFLLRSFSQKAVAVLKSETTSSQKLPLFEESEKARLFTSCVSSLPPKYYNGHKKLRSLSKLIFPAFVLAFILFSNRLIRYNAILGYEALLRSNNAHDDGANSYNVTTERPISISAPPWASFPVGAISLHRDGWKFTCSSNKDSDHDCKFAFNADWKTYWQSADDARGHSADIDLGRQVNVHSVAVKTAWSSPNLPSISGSVRGHRIEVAAEKGSWELVALGTWRDSAGGEDIFQRLHHLNRAY